MSEPKENYPDFNDISDNRQLVKKIIELLDCVKNIDKRVCFSQSELETNDDALSVHIRCLEKEYDILIKKISEIENILDCVKNIDSKVSVIEGKIEKLVVFLNIKLRGL